ncbi:MAG TPA: p-cumate dioxygenase [Gammaproteobacteria bacterium]|nr:p-cumate dioxygenase [Gammaproteobacteria bacterium]MCH77740.1 p-cumate dioxygenase [Gammaproteobacteria bacterium]
MADVTRGEVEDFLFYEAALLDDWETLAWADLYTEDAEYLIPPIDDPQADKRAALFVINDDHHRLMQRAKRLTRRTAHAEFPHSKIRHMISNVRILEQDDAGLLVASNQVVYRAKRQLLDTYVCHMVHRLAKQDGGLKIRSKRVMLDLDNLRPHGMVSIIL